LVILRMYRPFEPWVRKTWRPGEIEPMEFSHHAGMLVDARVIYRMSALAQS
jgi:hypothetical protein